VSTLHTIWDQYGQSPWLDTAARTVTNADALAEGLSHGIRGVTLTHASLVAALAGSGYDHLFVAARGRSSAEFVERLVVSDAKAMCDELGDVYRESRAAMLEKKQRYCDGLVVIPLSPEVAEDRVSCVADAVRIVNGVGRANVVVTIPATPAGLEAATEVLGAGISVNVALINAVSRYEEVLGAWLDGLELALANGVDLDGIASTASFALAPVDVVYDSLFFHRNDPRLGTSGVSTAAGIYRQYRKRVAERRTTALLERGAQLQRPLWTSTAPTNPTYFDLLYVNYMASFETAITMSPATMAQVLDHGDFTRSQLLSTRNIKRTSHLVKDLPRSFSHAAIARKLDYDEYAGLIASYESLVEAVQAKVLRLGP
jgi:transaldolase